MPTPEPYSHVSRLIVRYLTGDLNPAEQRELETWIHASDDHLHMMADFGSICWFAEESKAFEEPDKRVSWNLIQAKVALRPGTPPLPDLRVTEWTVRRRESLLRRLRAILLRIGVPALSGIILLGLAGGFSGWGFFLPVDSG